jgi:HEAT repeat protein
MKNRPWQRGARIAAVTAFVFIAVIGCGKKEEPARPLTVAELSSLSRAQELLQENRFNEVAAMAAQQPESPAINLVADIARRHKDNNEFDAGSPYLDAAKKPVGRLSEILKSERTPPEVLVAVLHDPSLTARALAISAVEARKEKSAVPRLIQLAQATTDIEEQAQIVCALSAIRDPRSIQVLKDYVNTPGGRSFDITRMATEALEAMGATP